MELNQEVHLSHYWNVIYKRWKVAVSILAVVMFGTFLASYFSKPLYKSTIQIQIERENPNQLTVDDLFGIAASDQEFLQTQYVLLKSRGLAQGWIGHWPEESPEKLAELKKQGKSSIEQAVWLAWVELFREIGPEMTK